MSLPLWLLKVSLATVIFVASQSSLSVDVKTVIKQQLENGANGWTVYRIARQASRMVIFYFYIYLFSSSVFLKYIIDLMTF